MKTEIYYFTGTGNSLYAARMIADRLGDCPLFPIVKALAGGGPIDGERIILVFPVYMFRAPHIVCRFVRRLRTVKTVIAIATMGGSSGKTLQQLRSILRKNGLALHAGYTITMPDNYTPFGDAMPHDEMNESLKEALVKIDSISKNIKNNEQVIEKNTSFFPLYLWPGALYLYAYGIIPKLARYFRVEDSCDGCGICARVCPSTTVTIRDNKPRWSDTCEQCLACLHWCPKEAIQYGKKTKGKNRYKNPFVNVRDIIFQKHL
jgi:ferredoxin